MRARTPFIQPPKEIIVIPKVIVINETSESISLCK